MTSSGGECRWRAALLKGLVLKDRDIEQTILQSVTQMVWMGFIYPRFHKDCNCCFEHKSFKYVRNGQLINKATFEKICKSIEIGHCPHIQRNPDPTKSETSDTGHWYLVPRCPHPGEGSGQLPQCYEREIDANNIMESKISLMEAAAAVGNHNIIPHMLLMAGQMDIGHFAWIYEREHGLHPIYIHSWELSARQKHTDVLQVLLSNDAPFGRTFRANVHDTYFIQRHLLYMVAHDCMEGLRLLLCILGKMECKPGLDKLVVSAILYNNPEILNELSKYVTIDSNILVSDDFHVSTWQLATLLGYHGCASEIQKHSTENRERITELVSESQINVIIWVLDIDSGGYLYVFHAHMVAETLKCLSMTTSILSDINVLQEIWKHILRRDDANVFSVMLENIGCDVDMSISISNRPRSSILCQFLWHKSYSISTWFESARQTVRTILKSNPSPYLHASHIINNACELDIEMLDWESSVRYYDIETFQLMKALPTDEFALRALITDPRFNEMIFFVPVFLQHGFTLDDTCTSIIKATSRKHPLLGMLYQSIVSTPRTLKSRARIVLRQAYPGRRIHDFANQTRLPVFMKEYILMTEELGRFCSS